MRIYTTRIEHTSEFVLDELPSISLTYHYRQKSRFRAALASGEAVGVDLSRTQSLKANDVIATADQNYLRILAEPETLMHVVATDAFALLKAAYHLGNRHVPLMVTPTALLFEPDHVLAEMLVRMGLVVSNVSSPFEPESGAYAQHQHAPNPLQPIEQGVSHPIDRIRSVVVAGVSE